MFIKMQLSGKHLEITQYEKKTSPRKNSGNRSSKPSGIYYYPRRSDSLVRSRKILLSRVLCAIEEFGAPLFATFTFSGCATRVYHSGECVAKFLRRLRADFSQAEAIIVPELSPGGRIHYHALLFNLPMHWGSVYQGKKCVFVGEERKTRKLAGYWNVGFVDLRQTDGSEKLAFYLAKYLVKAHGEPLFMPVRLVRTTLGFPKPWVTEMDDMLLNKILETNKPIWQGDYYSPFLGSIKKIKIKLK